MGGREVATVVHFNKEEYDDGAYIHLVYIIKICTDDMSEL
jgi:hypothetical protein